MKGWAIPLWTRLTDFFKSDRSQRGSLNISLPQFNVNENEFVTPTKGKQIVVLGVQHEIPEIVIYVRKSLGKLKQLGFTHVAIETIDSRAQQYIDAHEKNELTTQQLLDTLKEKNLFIGRSKLPDGTYEQLSLTTDEIIWMEQAKELGFKIVAMDNSDIVTYDKQDQINQPESDIGIRIIESTDVEGRELTMTSTIEKIVKQSQKNRIVVIVGSHHAQNRPAYGDMPTIRQQIESLGYSIVAINTNNVVKWDR
ncbi:TPA: hypothetical protein DIS60_04920 [Patescibacteria group bacterium]|nr:hypothetical protein [Patescibacteria group bacterium]